MGVSIPSSVVRPACGKTMLIAVKMAQTPAVPSTTRSSKLCLFAVSVAVVVRVVVAVVLL